MKLSYVQFVNNVSFGGQLQSATEKTVGDRPGQKPLSIDMGVVEGVACVSLTGIVNGVEKTRLVPMSNVASFDPAPVEVKPQAKK